MRVISCKAENFGSYKYLEFDFTKQGLTLIQGATGSGKSTLCDVIPWGLFGTTAKGGSVSDIISWPGDKVTKVILFLENVTISRSRGPKAKDNDLMFWPVNGEVTRGKDLQDTQKLINDFLSVNSDLYLAGAYFHEFSQTAQFFTTTAKNRRVICEQLVDLSLALKLTERIKDSHKSLNDYLGITLEEKSITESNLKLLVRHQEQEKNKASDWEKNHERIKQNALSSYEKFEASRKKILSKRCLACGTVLENPKETVDTSENPYIERLQELEKEKNPHSGAMKDFSNEISSSKEHLANLTRKESELNLELSDLDILQDSVSQYRSATISNTIQSIEDQTNKYLSDNFDAEIKVVFSAKDVDKLDVTILKDGNEANYTQLSKGQRCLLKLCFGTSVMQAVQNHHGVKFNQIFFDEALDGLDGAMKTKAYRLLSILSQDYEGVFVVEHSEELKALFTNKYTVDFVNGESSIWHR